MIRRLADTSALAILRHVSRQFYEEEPEQDQADDQPPQLNENVERQCGQPDDHTTEIMIVTVHEAQAGPAHMSRAVPQFEQ